MKIFYQNYNKSKVRLILKKNLQILIIIKIIVLFFISIIDD